MSPSNRTYGMNPQPQAPDMLQQPSPDLAKMAHDARQALQGLRLAQAVAFQRAESAQKIMEAAADDLNEANKDAQMLTMKIAALERVIDLFE